LDLSIKQPGILLLFISEFNIVAGRMEFKSFKNVMTAKTFNRQMVSNANLNIRQVFDHEPF